MFLLAAFSQHPGYFFLLQQIFLSYYLRIYRFKLQIYSSYKLRIYLLCKPQIYLSFKHRIYISFKLQIYLTHKLRIYLSHNSRFICRTSSEFICPTRSGFWIENEIYQRNELLTQDLFLVYLKIKKLIRCNI